MITDSYEKPALIVVESVWRDDDRKDIYVASRLLKPQQQFPVLFSIDICLTGIL